MDINIVTLFPKMFDGPFKYSIIKRATDKNLVNVSFIDLRQYGLGERKTVDDKPYGGGVGMILMVEPIEKALAAIKGEGRRKTILLDAGGEKFTQIKAKEYSKLDGLTIICGHYEGVDARVHEALVDEVISIGDFILTGGEIPAMVITDSVARLIPGVLEKPTATENESFSQGYLHNYLEYPQYTRPEKYKELKVPEILLSGNHKEIQKWRDKKAEEKTKKVRPDIIRPTLEK